MKHGKINILFDLQHGLRDERSCESQLIGVIDDVFKAIRGGHQTDVIIIDFSEAFDNVCDHLLVDKLTEKCPSLVPGAQLSTINTTSIVILFCISHGQSTPELP